MSVQPAAGEPRGVRISDADRERAAARLNQAMSEGRITVAELDERLTIVYAARYAADLLPPFVDLPGEQVATPAAALPASAVPPVVLRAGMSTIKRSGAWTVPARLRVQSSMGSVVLDFCETPIPHPVVEIELELGAGSARLLVPEDATADVDGVVATMGSVRSKVPSVAVPGKPHFRVYGNTGMGSIIVRHRYRVAGYYF